MKKNELSFDDLNKVAGGGGVTTQPVRPRPRRRSRRPCRWDPSIPLRCPIPSVTDRS